MSAFSRKCNGDDFDNTLIIKKIVKLKHKRARLLGFDNFADYILEKRMAENQDNIMNFFIVFFLSNKVRGSIVQLGLPTNRKGRSSLRPSSASWPCSNSRSIN